MESRAELICKNKVLLFHLFKCTLGSTGQPSCMNLSSKFGQFTMALEHGERHKLTQLNMIPFARNEPHCSDDSLHCSPIVHGYILKNAIKP